MSPEFEERLLAFKKDLEVRLQTWLKEHPEAAPQKLLPANSPDRPFTSQYQSPIDIEALRAASHTPILPQDGKTASVSDKGNLKVSVLPSNYLDGGWCVWINGVMRTSYYGPLAHSKATKYAAKVLSGELDPNDPDSDDETSLLDD